MGKWLIRNTEEPEENQSRGTDRTSTAMNVSHAKREEPAGQHGRTDRRGGPVGHELREADPIRTMTGMMGLC